jgi:hypothetical protein
MFEEFLFRGVELGVREEDIFRFELKCHKGTKRKVLILPLFSVPGPRL